MNCLISLPPAKDICGWQGHLPAAGKSENFPFIHYEIIPRAPSDFQDIFCCKKTIFERNRENSCIICTKCYQASQPPARKKSSRHFSRLRPPRPFADGCPQTVPAPLRLPAPPSRRRRRRSCTGRIGKPMEPLIQSQERSAWDFQTDQLGQKDPLSAAAD